MWRATDPWIPNIVPFSHEVAAHLRFARRRVKVFANIDITRHDTRSVTRRGGHMGLLYSIVVGLIAGWLAGQVMRGGGYGVLMDIVLGILGGVVGGWLFGALGIWPGGGLIGAICVSFVGAVILVAITRMLKRA